MLTWARLANAIIDRLGWATASLGLLLVVLQSMIVFNRYFFAQNQYFGLFTTFYDELLLVGFSALFMLGSAFAFNRDAHVRVDIIYAALGSNGQARINFLGTLLFMIPFAAALYYFSLSNIEQAWKLAEASHNGDGVQFVWVWKTFVPAFCLLTLFSAFGHLIENFARITQNVSLTNIVFGVVFIVLGAVGLWAAVDLSINSVFDDDGAALNWVAYAETRKPTPEYRLILWEMIVWGARLGSVLLICLGACSSIRGALGWVDVDGANRLLACLAAGSDASLGKA